MPSLEAGNKTQHETSKSNSTNLNMEHVNPKTQTTKRNTQMQKHKLQNGTRKSNSTIHNMEHAKPTAHEMTILWMEQYRAIKY
jgi:hypothetical protein